MTSLYNGGAEKSLVNLLNELDYDKYDVDLLLLKKKGIFLNQVPERVNLLEVPEGIKLMYSPELVKGHFFKKARRLIVNAFVKTFIRRDCYARAARWKHLYCKEIKQLDKKYDISVGYITGELLYLITEKTKADRKVLWVHNDYIAEDQPREFDLPYMEKMDAIVSISDKCVNVLKEVFPQYSDKIYEIGNITSSVVVRKQGEDFLPSEYKKDRLTLVSVGRLAEQKGFDIGIRAAKILKDKGLSFDWFVLGTGAMEDKLRSMVKELELEDSFHLIGARENPYPYIKNADFLVQPSRYEGKSVVLDETKILGTPIVVTDYPTVKDQIKPDDEGIIVPITPEGIADGIMKMADDRELREHIRSFLLSHEYGNQSEIVKYDRVLTGDFT